MGYARIVLAIVGLLLLAGTSTPASAADATIAPICKALVRCAGCSPVYRCRVCRKRPICTHGVCIYRTICGWGPAIPSLPKGARVVRVR